jgi:hypothetical protein
MMQMCRVAGGFMLMAVIASPGLRAGLGGILYF